MAGMPPSSAIWVPLAEKSPRPTESETGRHVWHDLALPKIYGDYDAILADFSVSDSLVASVPVHDVPASRTTLLSARSAAEHGGYAHCEERCPVLRLVCSQTPEGCTGGR